MAHDMLKRCYACAVVLTFGCTHVESRGVELAFQFSGQVGSLFEPEPFWGRTVPILTPVTGRFVFDPSAPATYSTPGCDCTGYLQQHVNGLSADFGDMAVRADQYVVDVSNDIDQGEGILLDFLTIRWASDLTPPLTAPLLVNDFKATAGMFSVAFGFDSTTFSDSALPTALSVADFFLPSEFNLLSDYDPIPGLADVAFAVEAVAPVAFIAGDFNYDQKVDGADFVKWQRTHADAAGLSAWRSAFGALPPPAASLGAVVPEPVGFALAAIPALLAAARRSRSLPQGRLVHFMRP